MPLADDSMELLIGNRLIGDGHPLFFIAEAGVNHNGSIDTARRLIDEARAAGADAIKFQTFKTELLNTRTSPKSSYHVATTGTDAEQTWFELLKTQELDRAAHEALIEHSRQAGIMFLSTPYDLESAAMLADLGVPAFKLASTDTSNLPLLSRIAGYRVPVILSTAMCTMAEVHEALRALRGGGATDLVVMQCTGNYPAALEDSNLRVLPRYRAELHCLVGYSDHTPELINPIAATALGACMYEKHFTLDRTMPGPDHRMSLDPPALRATIDAIRQTERALGVAEKRVLPSEEENRAKLRKSLVAATAILPGVAITEAMLAIKRPGTGLAPARLQSIVGRRLRVAVDADTVLTEEMLEP